jgi:hypothetical protein
MSHIQTPFLARASCLIVVLVALPAAGLAQINYALQSEGGVATQSSNYLGIASAPRANDGGRDGRWGSNSVSHTIFQTGAWWQVQLNDSYVLEEIMIWNRTDDDLAGRLSPFRLTIYNGAAIAWEQANITFVDNVNDGLSYTAGMLVTLPGTVTGDRVRISLMGTNFLHLAEVETYGVVPEPATLAAVGIGVCALLRRRRKTA